ncbi:MAG: 3-methyl-2-oxobutanoate hydroxymethyltransferase [Alphaproteobacteria bacterium]
MDRIGRLTQNDLQNIYKSGEKIVCLTAYTTPVARVLDKHCDLLLVGDSLGMVVYGMDNTLGVTLDMMINHGQAVMRGVKHSFVVVDMPYGSYEHDAADAVMNAKRVIDETGCDAIKIEGGLELLHIYHVLAAAEIPTVAHIGLQPQSVEKEGGYKLKGRNDAETAELIRAAQEIEKTGVIALVIEGTVEQASRAIVDAVSVPTIGIGASPYCDGQILVTDDMLGLFVEHVPKFVKQYAQLAQNIDAAAAQYSHEVRAGVFPSDAHVYKRAS